MAGGRDQPVEVLGVEHRREASNRCERKRPVLELLEQQRKSPHRARDLDPRVGGGLREVEQFRAVGEHRRATEAQIQPPKLDLGQVGDEVGRSRALLRRQLMDALVQLVVGERGEQVATRSARARIAGRIGRWTGEKCDRRVVRGCHCCHDSLSFKGSAPALRAVRAREASCSVVDGECRGVGCRQLPWQPREQSIRCIDDVHQSNVSMYLTNIYMSRQDNNLPTGTEAKQTKPKTSDRMPTRVTTARDCGA